MQNVITTRFANKVCRRGGGGGLGGDPPDPPDLQTLSPSHMSGTSLSSLNAGQQNGRTPWEEPLDSPPPHPPPDQSDHRGKKPLGKSGRASFGAPPFGSQTRPLLSEEVLVRQPGVIPAPVIRYTEPMWQSVVQVLSGSRDDGLGSKCLFVNVYGMSAVKWQRIKSMAALLRIQVLIVCELGAGVRSLVYGAGSYSVAHRAGLLPTELTGMWGWILLRSPHHGRGSPPAPAPH